LVRSLAKQIAADFLKRFKEGCACGKFTFIPRRPNLEAITSLGITLTDVKEIILGLTTDNYCRGPEADEDGSAGEVWVFGTVVDGIEIYIKLKVDNDFAKCISFHQPDYNMNFPLHER
jgi:hypothetical protein